MLSRPQKNPVELAEAADELQLDTALCPCPLWNMQRTEQIFTAAEGLERLLG